ncbi:AraC family transcriptional regulator [Sphingobium aromaticiconvertens]|uniref:AraC family transcriptional regulator n=1 Tax=Sphingobium aromaticiconvertens TaxID=365341 RepID=UPI0030198489
MSGRPALPPQADHIALLVQADGLLTSSGGSAEEFSYMLLAAVASTEVSARFGGPCPKTTAKRIQDVVHWIEQAPHQRQGLSALAESAGMSPFHFLREFKGLTGMTPHQFVLAQRLRRAAAHLREDDAPVSEVAFDAGFGDLSEFNRRFRRLMGTTPIAFRARNKHPAP